MKKIISIVLAVLLVCAIAVPAFAEGTYETKEVSLNPDGASSMKAAMKTTGEKREAT